MSTRVFTIGLSSFMIFALASVATAKEFVDVPQDHAQRVSIDYLSELEIFKGQQDGQSFTPDQPINRAEWAEILLRQSGKDIEPTQYRDCFFDIFAQWFAPAICYAAEQGWMKGYQSDAERGFFFPVRVITSGEILVTLDRAFGWNVTEGEQWFSGALEYAKKANIVTQGMAFDQPLSRAAAAEILFRSLALQELKVTRYDPFLGELFASSSEEDPVITPDQPVQTTNTVTLAPFPDQPAKATMPRGALYVPVIRFQLTSEDKVTLDRLSIERLAIGRTQDLRIGRLLVNGKVIKEGPFLASDDATDWFDLNLPLNPGEVFLIEMNVDFIENAFAGLTYQFQISPEDIHFKEEVQIQGSAVRGLTFQTGPLAADVVTVENPSSSVNLPFVESVDQIIGRFTVTAGLHDVLIKRLRIEDAGDITNAHFSNFRLNAGSQTIGTTSSIERNVLDFPVNDYLIEAGRERTFTVMADIGDANRTDTIRLYLQDPEDLHAEDVEFGFGARVSNKFDIGQAWCLGSKTTQCPVEGLRKRCSKEDREWEIEGCEP